MEYQTAWAEWARIIDDEILEANERLETLRRLRVLVMSRTVKVDKSGKVINL